MIKYVPLFEKFVVGSSGELIGFNDRDDEIKEHTVEIHIEGDLYSPLEHYKHVAEKLMYKKFHGIKFHQPAYMKASDDPRSHGNSNTIPWIEDYNSFILRFTCKCSQSQIDEFSEELEYSSNGDDKINFTVKTIEDWQ